MVAQNNLPLSLEKPEFIPNSFVINIDKDPVCLLYDVFPDVKLSSTKVVGVHNKCSFEVSIRVNNKFYTAIDRTYQLAKKLVSLTVLNKLCNVFYDTKKMQLYIHVPVPDLKKLSKDVKEVNDAAEMEPAKDLSSCSSVDNRLQTIATYNKKKGIDLKSGNNSVLPHKKPSVIQEILVITPSAIRTDLPMVNKEIGRKSNSATPLMHSNMEHNALKNSKIEILTVKSNAQITNTNEEYSPPIKKAKPPQYRFTTASTTVHSMIEHANNAKGCERFEYNLINFEDPVSDSVNEVMKISQVDVLADFKQHDATINLKRTHTICVTENIRPAAAPKDHHGNHSACQLCKKRRSILRNWSKQNKNPRVVLNELCPGLQYKLESEIGVSHSPFFLMSVMVNDRKYYGHGKTKILARKDAATQILYHFAKIGYVPRVQVQNYQNNQGNETNVLINSETIVVSNNSSTLLLPQNQADLVEQKVMNMYEQLTQGRQEFLDYKVLSGIVMTRNLNFQEACVVAISTGTKCLNGGNICENGSVLNDSHAEIVARRCLMKFLYEELSFHCNPQSARKSIFEKSPNGSWFFLKPNIHFHLYINTAPCGDARTFSGKDRSTSNYSNFNSYYGQLRTKVEGGIGTTPVGQRYYCQTTDGVRLGEPLLTMSCSDKIARWNVLGLQGSLLSTLIDPIYLHSIVLGSMFNHQHMYRAICGRIEQSLSHLPVPYRLNRPLLGQSSKPLPRSTRRPPSIGFNWSYGDSNIEAISLPSGRTIYNDTSSLTKQALFRKYLSLLQSLSCIPQNYITNNYAEAKSYARDFQSVKNEFFAALQRAELGCWVKKPIEQNEFTIH